MTTLYLYAIFPLFLFFSSSSQLSISTALRRICIFLPTLATLLLLMSPPLSSETSSSSLDNKRHRTPSAPDKCLVTSWNMTSSNRAFQDRIRAAIANEKNSQKRQLLVAQLYAENREQHLPNDRAQLDTPSFPGKGASNGCEHYQRFCWIKAPCCEKYYPCRRCHDSHQSHEIDRYAIVNVACVRCGHADQPVAKHCRQCRQPFAHYFCDICNFFDNSPGRNAYHCPHCRMCRVGKGLDIDQYHCHQCNNCVPIHVRDSHPCRERSLDANCPICAHYLATSTEPVVFTKCGHPMHRACLEQHAETSYTCPICHKCLTDMSDYFEALDKRIALDVIPSEYANRVSKVLCHDCEQKTPARFHFIYHKCANCSSYNTRVLHQFDYTPNPVHSSSALSPTQQQQQTQQRNLGQIQGSAATS